MDISNECNAYVEGIAHPNEKTLAKEILEGKKLGEFSLSFDQAQVDAMTERLKGGGCFPEPVEEPVKEETEEPKKDDAGGIGEDSNDVQSSEPTETVKDETEQDSELITPNLSAPVGETGQGMDTPQASQQA